MPRSLPELLALLGPLDRTTLLTAWRAGARVDKGVALDEVRRLLPDEALANLDACLSRLSSHPFSFFATHGSSDLFLTPVAFVAIKLLFQAHVQRPVSPPPKLPFVPDNPRLRTFVLERAFEEDVKGIAKDGNLRDPLRKKFEDALADPTRAKVLVFGPYKGCRSDHVARNFRLVYREEGDRVVFVRFLPKDDPHYKE